MTLALKSTPGPSVRTVSGQKFGRVASSPSSGSLEKRCPVCGRQGRKVTSLTLTAHLRPEHWDHISEGFWFCWTSTCPILYYDNNRGVYVSKDPREVRSRFGPKEEEAPRPICYCLGVTMDRILDEVVNKGCCDSLEDIERFTRAGTGKWCLTTNPSGVCCRVYLKDVVAQALKVARSKARPAARELAKTLEDESREPTVLTSLQVGGMDCESCTLAVAAALEHAGARSVAVSLKEERARFERPASRAERLFLEALSDAGYTASSENDSSRA